MEDTSPLLEDSGEQSTEWAMAIAKAKEIVNGLDQVVLNIAVTGETGVGKSSFVNAIRGVQRGDEGWAPTGVTETTMEPKEYPHPSMPNVRIWDLPGIGTPSFDAKRYVNKVHFEKYDFFIIVSASRFRENDLKLANEIKKTKKKFYFVRSKIDKDVKNEIEDGGGTEEEILLKMRKDCEDNLRDLGGAPVFLITSKDLTKYDFPNLVDTLKRELPVEKMDVLLQSFPVFSKQSLDWKYQAFNKNIWQVAAASGIVGAAPVPGLSFAVDTAMVMSFLTGVYRSFGLHDKALEKLSETVDKPILGEVKKSKIIQEISKYMLTSSMQPKLLASAAVNVLSLIPVAGSIAAATLSYKTTRAVLQQGLDELYQVAKKVLEMADLQ
ncbi:interferon-inducible GTPase 5-like [Engraulis encrasicolus]|uniref:interferon-inducible GTPase 5-like n=1 Tax=Engraulis encrasicolus TaxID=184585 RepID=UPI002FD4EB3A